MASDAIPPNLLERFFAAVELFTSREENRQEPVNAENELVDKNIIKSPATTFGGNPPVTSSLQPVERDRARSIGLILAKAFYDFNQSKKADTKEGTKISPIRAKAAELGIGRTDKGKKTEADQGEGLFGSGGLLGGIMDAVDFIDDIRDLRKAWKNRRGRGIPRPRSRGIPRTRIPTTRPQIPRLPAIPRRGVPGRPILTPPTSPPITRLPPIPRAPSVPSMPKPPGGAGRMGKLLSRIPGVGKLAAGGLATAAGGAAAAETAGAASKLSGLARVGGGAMKAASVAGKFAGPLALAIDAQTTLRKLISKEGREDLRKTGEEYSFEKSGISGVLLKSLSPIETLTGITLQVGDMFDSMKRAKESEAALKVAEVKSKQKTEERMSKFDVDKSGKIDTAERLRMYKEQKKSGTVEDERGKRWRYSAKEDKLLSADGNEALTMEEFLKKNYLKPVPEPKAIEPQKEKAPEKPMEPPVLPQPPQPIEPPPIQPTIFAKIPPAPIPAQPTPARVPPVSVKPEINLDSQNSLIIAQTHILGEMLNISRQQLVTTKNQKPANVNVSQPIASINTGSMRNESDMTGDPRTFYAQSPYNLLPT